MNNQPIGNPPVDLNDRRISYHASQKGGFLGRIIRKMTRRFWADQVRDPINRLYERGVINSKVYHEAHDYATRVIYATPPPECQHEFASSIAGFVCHKCGHILLAILALIFLTGCTDSPGDDPHRQGKVQDGVNSNFGGN